MKTETMHVRKTDEGKFVVVTTRFEDGQFVNAEDHETEHTTVEVARDDMELCAAGADEFWTITGRDGDTITLTFDEDAAAAAKAELQEQR